MRKDFLGLWLAGDGKAVYIEKRLSDYSVTVKPSIDEDCYLRPHLYVPRVRTFRMKACWNKTEKEFPFLQVEAGAEDIGPTYHLVFAVKKSEGEEPPYRLAMPDDDLENIVALPETQIGLYDDWEDDLGVPWALPLLPLKHANQKEESIFLKKHRSGSLFSRVFKFVT